MAAKARPGSLAGISKGVEVPVSVLGIDAHEEMLWVSLIPLPIERFPPCIKNIILKGDAENPDEMENVNEKGKGKETDKGKGATRAAAILAAFLGQAGWSEADARTLWSELVKRAGMDVENRIFDEWFGRMHCPKCETLKKESKGYPDLGVANLGICRPDEACDDFEGPVEHAAGIREEDNRSSGTLRHIKTVYRARVLDWSSGREGEIDLSAAEKDELEGLIKEQTDSRKLMFTRTRLRGRLRPKFFLKDSDELRKRVLSEVL